MPVPLTWANISPSRGHEQFRSGLQLQNCMRTSTVRPKRPGPGEGTPQHYLTTSVSVTTAQHAAHALEHHGFSLVNMGLRTTTLASHQSGLIFLTFCRRCG